jgi:hypothetical protein
MFKSPIIQQSYFLLVIFISVQLLTSGCGYISLTRKTQFVPETEDVTISIAEEEEGPFTKVKDKDYKIKLNHWKKNYWVKQERNGFVSQTIEVQRSAANHLKRVDILSAVSLNVVTGIMGIITIQNVVQGTGFTPPPRAVLYSGIGLSLASWGAILPAPGKLFPKKIELPELLPILKRDTGQLWLVANETEFRLKKKGIRGMNTNRGKNMSMVTVMIREILLRLLSFWKTWTCTRSW